MVLTQTIVYCETEGQELLLLAFLAAHGFEHEHPEAVETPTEDE